MLTGLFLLLVSSILTSILRYADTIKNSLIFCHDYFQLLHFVKGKKFKDTVKKGKDWFFQKKNCFRPTRDERLGVVRDFQFGLMVQAYEAKFIDHMHTSHKTREITMPIIIKWLYKYHEWLEKSGSSTFLKSVKMYNEDTRKTGKIVDSQVFQENQMKEYLESYYTNYFEYSKNDALHDSRTSGCDLSMDLGKCKAAITKSSYKFFVSKDEKDQVQDHNAQIQFMLNYCATRKATLNFVKVM